MKPNSTTFSSLSRAVGLIYDRTALGDEPLCSAFLVANNRVATVASLITPYAKHLHALKVVFPIAETAFGVAQFHVHPKFDRRLARQTLTQGILTTTPEAALQKFNCCLLQLTDQLPALNEAAVEEVSKSIRYPLDMSEEGLAGTLTEIELPLVLQTLNNAKKQGVLYLCDDLNRPFAQIFCQGGRIVSAKFKNLLNETALYQIVAKNPTARFAFRACKQPNWLPQNTIKQSPDMLLIEAHRRLDELARLKHALDPAQYCFVRSQKNLFLDGISDGDRPAAESIWRVLDGVTGSDDLWQLIGLDDYSIYQALSSLSKANQIMRVPIKATTQIEIMSVEAAQEAASEGSKRLRLGVKIPLNAFESIASLYIDPTANNKPRPKVGSLLGAIDAYDPWHLLHNIPLLPVASGSPLLKDDYVIGMHCGVVPSSNAVSNDGGLLQQMLWCDAIAQCLKEVVDAEELEKATAFTAVMPSPEMSQQKLQALTPGQTTKNMAPGCREIACLKCANCGERTFSSARQCQKCFMEFIPAAEPVRPGKKFNFILPAATILLVAIAAGAFIAWARLPQPAFANVNISIPSNPWLKMTILKEVYTVKGNTSVGAWVPQERGTSYTDMDRFHIRIDALKDLDHVYLLFQGTSDVPDKVEKPSLKFPTKGDTEMVREGAYVTLPRIIQQLTPTGQTQMIGISFGGRAGTDKLIAIATTGAPFDWLEDSQKVEIAFNKAHALLATAKNQDGILVAADQIRPDGDTNPLPPGSPKNVFIAELDATHTVVSKPGD
jgi:hypothetical protein